MAVEPPIKEPIVENNFFHSPVWPEFFNAVKDGCGCIDPLFVGPEGPDAYDHMFRFWCMGVQASINAVSPGTIEDPPFHEKMQGGQFGPVFQLWLVSIGAAV